jgi:hypothetical protein
MDNIDKYIDEMFRRKLSGAGAPVSPSGAEWMQLSKAIQRNNFMRFTPASFNVYYLAAAVGTIATVGAITLPEILSTNQKDNNIPEQVNTVTDSLPTEKDTVFETTPTMFIPSQEKATEKKKCREQEPIIIQEPNNTGYIENQAEKETISEDSTNNCPSVIHEIRENIKETLPVEADTIINVDTIRVQKKGVQFKRKRTTF